MQWCGSFGPSIPLIFWSPDFDKFSLFFVFGVKKYLLEPGNRMVVIISTVNTPNILVPWFWWFFIFSFVVSKNTYSNQGIQWCGLFAPSGHLIFLIPDFDDFFTFFSFLVSKNIYSSQGNQWCWQIWIVNTPNFLVPDFNIFFTLSMFFRFRRKDLVGISLRILLLSIQISNDFMDFIFLYLQF